MRGPPAPGSDVGLKVVEMRQPPVKVNRNINDDRASGGPRWRLCSPKIVATAWVKRPISVHSADRSSSESMDFRRRG